LQAEKDCTENRDAGTAYLEIIEAVSYLNRALPARTVESKLCACTVPTRFNRLQTAQTRRR
jgi:hypothetical protein